MTSEVYSDLILDQYFYFYDLILKYSPSWRTDPYSLDRIIDACRAQISISPKTFLAFQQRPRFKILPTPSHVGFSTLVEVFSFQERFKEAIELAERAKEEGWTGDWDNQINLLRKLESKHGVPKIIQLIKDSPGILQTEIYKMVDLPRDTVSTLLYWWGKTAKIERKKKGKTYQLYFIPHPP